MASLAKIIPETSQTVQAIYAYWEGKLETRRGYLGGSVIGRECERELWYGFRWTMPAKGQFEGRMLRLFNRGHREEAVFVEELRGIGVDVRDVDPSTGEQFRFKAVGGHFGGGIDGVALGVIEAPKTWHLVEFKTHNAKSFAALEKDGVQKSKPEHFAQMQIYMHMADLTRALYLAVNKDTDALYSERIRADATEAKRLIEKAERVIYSPEPLERLSQDPAHYKCRMCSLAQVCHGTKLPQVSCRTCVHVTPEPDGDGRWSCALAAGETIPGEVQPVGCPSHRYIPALLKAWGEVEDAGVEENWISYRAADGFTFRNGDWGLDSYTSLELQDFTPKALRDPVFQEIRAKTNATFAGAQDLEKAA